MKTLVKGIASVRLTAVMMVILPALLLSGVIALQSTVVADKTLRSGAATGHVSDFLLHTLGLSHVATSPLFLSLLALFFANLIAVLVLRFGATLRRMRVRVPEPELLNRWVSRPDALLATLPSSWSDRGATTVLRGFGYRTVRSGDRAIWGVKHRTAPFGFLLLHVSFIALFVGAATIYATRTEGHVRLIEGQTWEGVADNIRRAPALRPRPLTFTLALVEPKFDRGEATDLSVSLLMAPGHQRPASVNHPVEWGNTTLLVTDVGVAPVLLLRDARGFTLDQVVAPAEHDRPTEVPMAARRYVVTIDPLVSKENFPAREALGRVPVDVIIREGATVVGRGRLTVGQSIEFGGARLGISDMRYWSGLRIVAERGGSILVLGYFAAVAGAVWRLIMHRREVALSWDSDSLRLMGKTEFFGVKFRDELEAMLKTLQALGPEETK